VEKPHKRKTESAEPKVEMKMTFVTFVRSLRAERKTTPGTEALLRIETTREPWRVESWRVRAKAGEVSNGWWRCGGRRITGEVKGWDEVAEALDDVS
jgi:hypothetical protein